MSHKQISVFSFNFSALKIHLKILTKFCSLLSRSFLTRIFFFFFAVVAIFIVPSTAVIVAGRIDIIDGAVVAVASIVPGAVVVKWCCC